MQIPPFSLSTQLTEISSELDAAVLRVLKSGKYIGGEEVQIFEESFASEIGVDYVVGCNSGTDALILALRALNIGPGDEVITPSFSFFATAEAISSVGARPVFVEVDSNFLINLASVGEVITSSTKAIMPVHLFGCPVDMDALMEIANDFNLKVIEDCAQAAGTKWDGKSVGSFGDIGCFSFFPTKNLGAAGDGGAIATNDLRIAQTIRKLAIHGMPRRYFHTSLGYNSRLDAIQAAVLNVKLPKLSSWIRKREFAADRYLALLKDLPEIGLPTLINKKKLNHSWNQFVVRVKDNPLKKDIGSKNILHEFDYEDLIGKSHSENRDALKNYLEIEGVNTIIYYPIPIHLQPAYKEIGCKYGSLPLTEKICSEVLSLPIFPEITYDQQKYVVEKIINFFRS